MALLAVDIRNGHTSLGLLRGAEVVSTWRVSSDPTRTSDEWGVLVRGLVGHDTTDVDGVALCATVPAVLHEWRAVLTDSFGDVPHVVVEPGTRTGLPVLMDNPREVGADRICNAVAAATGGVPAVVVDFGPATTFDVVDAEGRYVGGVIAPGIETSLEVLGDRAAQLRQVELARPRRVIAKNTVEAMQSGLVFGFASQVEGLVGRIIAELGVAAADLRVVATGHLAPLIVDECGCFTHHEPWLTLQGLRLLFERNAD
jgi:type III pantothenate kinase